jgi:cytochrome c553
MTTTRNRMMGIGMLAIAGAAALPATDGHASAPEGRAARTVYDEYGCVGCHGDSGKGACDLRDANLRFPTDAALRAFIERPSSVHPGSKMPAYEHVVAEEDYEPLLRHVRDLSRNKK